MSEKHTQPYSACYDLTDLTTCVYAVVMMTMMLMICCIQQRQERFTDCSALLELERKVNTSLLLLFKLHLRHYCHPCCLLTLSPLPLPPLEPLSHLFSLTFHGPSSSSLHHSPLSLPSHSPSRLPWHHQDRRMLERRMAELEEELKVRRLSYRGHRHFACFRLISLALACAEQAVLLEVHCGAVYTEQEVFVSVMCVGFIWLLFT